MCGGSGWLGRVFNKFERYAAPQYANAFAAVNLLACATIFTLDAAAPTGVSFNQLYILIIIGSFFSSPRAPVIWGAVSTLFSIAAIFIAPVQLEFEWEVADRVITILSIWGAAALVMRLRILRDTALSQTATARENEASKVRFLSAASHDLRQPVQSLLLFATVLEAKLENHPARHVARSILTTAGALKGLLEGIFDLSRLDAGAFQPEMATFKLETLLAGVAAEYMPRAAEKGISLRTVSCSLATRSDRGFLERIVRNLLENAVKYTERGGVLIGASRRGGAVRIDVIDTGPGIPETLREKIFDEFFQVGNAERSRERGYGLGLSIVRRTAALLGHRIEVQSKIGRGTRISVYVPLVAPPKEVVEAPARAASVSPGLRVVVIEDDPLVCEALRASLEQAGCVVVVARSGAEAVATAMGAAPAFLVCDYRLPGALDGIQIIAQIRREMGKDIPACVLTGDLDPTIDTKAARMAVPLLRKPVSSEDLLGVLERSCRSLAG